MLLYDNKIIFLKCFTKHGYFTMHRLLWSKELLNYTVPFICHFGKTKESVYSRTLALHPMEVAVLQKVEPKILGSLKLHVEDDLSTEVLKISYGRLWSELKIQ